MEQLSGRKPKPERPQKRHSGPRKLKKPEYLDIDFEKTVQVCPIILSSHQTRLRRVTNIILQLTETN